MIESQFLYAFNYSTCEIYSIKVKPEETSMTGEEILENRGIKSTDCHYMFSKNKLSIKFIDTVNKED